MKQVKALEVVLAKLPDFAFSRFRILQSFKLWREDGGEYQIALMMRSEDYDKQQYELSLSFTNVSRVSMNRIGGGEIRIVGFDIVNIETRGWEDVSFEVTDFEGKTLGFLCGDARVDGLRIIRDAR